LGFALVFTAVTVDEQVQFVDNQVEGCMAMEIFRMYCLLHGFGTADETLLDSSDRYDNDDTTILDESYTEAL
jgi:hypothetical protein